MRQGGPEGSIVNWQFKIAFFPVLGISIFSLLSAQFPSLLGNSVSFDWFTVLVLGAFYVFCVIMVAMGYAIFKWMSGSTASAPAVISGLLAGAAVSSAILFTSCFVGLFIQFR